MMAIVLAFDELTSSFLGKTIVSETPPIYVISFQNLRPRRSHERRLFAFQYRSSVGILRAYISSCCPFRFCPNFYFSTDSSTMVFEQFVLLLRALRCTSALRARTTTTRIVRRLELFYCHFFLGHSSKEMKPRPHRLL